MEGHGEAVEALLDAGADAAVQVTHSSLVPWSRFLQSKSSWPFVIRSDGCTFVLFVESSVMAACQDNDGSDAPEWARDLEHDDLVAMFEAKAGSGGAEPEPEPEPETEA